MRVAAEPAARTRTSVVEKDGDDFVIPLPADLLEELGWKPGDNLDWTTHEDGTFSVRKATD